MAKTGRPRRNSVEALAAAVDACIAAYEDSGDAQDLTDYALAQRLRVSIDTLDRYYMGKPDEAMARARAYDAERRAASGDDSGDCSDDNSGDNTGSNRTYNGELKRLIQYRSAACTSHIARGGQVTGWIFLSKQPRWGGYSDTQRVDTHTKSDVTVTLRGADGKPIL